MRLDKYLAQAGMGTRSEVKKWIRSGRVLLNGTVAKRPEEAVEEGDEVLLNGEMVCLEKQEYYMLHKPAGVVSATKDLYERTVVELITCPHAKDLFPVGRLDKDTEGLLVLTNDGALAHELLSPRKHVEKTYFVRIQGHMTEEDRRVMADGMDIGDQRKTEPAKLFGEKAIGNETELKITITEGRYHQIKRMFGKLGKPVVYLKRLSMGGLVLDEALRKGEYRKLTSEEVAILKEKKNRC